MDICNVERISNYYYYYPHSDSRVDFARVLLNGQVLSVP